jgi:hypothetical protein
VSPLPPPPEGIDRWICGDCGNPIVGTGYWVPSHAYYLCADCYTATPMPADEPTPVSGTCPGCGTWSRMVLETGGECFSCSYLSTEEVQIPGSEILTEAHALVNRDRGSAYGHPSDDYGRTVDAFTAPPGHSLSTAEGVLFMACVKLSREMHEHATDNLRDLAGYAACLEMVHQRI